MFSLYRTSAFGLRTLIQKSVTRVHVDHHQGCILRLLHTNNILRVPKDTNDKPQDWNLSEAETEFVLEKFNKSSAQDLKKIRFIGLPLAQGVVSHRESKGYFNTIDDLLLVPRIGPKSIHTILESVLAEPDTEPVVEEPFESGYGPVGEETVVNLLNTSSEEKLAKTKSVGKKTGKFIVEHREENGHFDTLNDVLKVKTIGKKRLEKMCKSILEPNVDSDADLEPFDSGYDAAGDKQILETLNTFDEEELAGIKTVGKVTSEIIVGHRAEKGDFITLNDVLKVRTIGKKRLAKICTMILEPPSDEKD